MKKVISVILALAMSLSLTTVFAEKSKGDLLSEQATIDFAVQNGICKGNDLDKTIEATRSEAAGILGRAIGVAETGATINFSDVDKNDINYKEISALAELEIIKGSGDIYRPNDHITREEAAIIIERIYKRYFDDILYDREIKENRFLDFNDISEWAKQAVFNVVENGIMWAEQGRTFGPKKNITTFELVELGVKIFKLKNQEPVFTVGDAMGDPEAKYQVYQKGIIQPSGTAGFGMLARFDGAPGEVYVARTTTKPKYEHTNGAPTDPVVFARIIDPDGKVIARVDLNYIESGKMAKVINIPDGKAGIWTIQVVNGRMDDVVEIGVNNAISWGIRGEPYFKLSDTTPRELYIWAPEKVTTAAIGSISQFTVKDVNGKTVASPSNVNYTYSKYQATFSPEASTAYKIEFPQTGNPTLCMRGIPRVVCPTPEMAADLKGGYVMTEDGILTHGPLQARARKAAVDLYNKRGGDMTVTIDRPEEVPEIKGNIFAEAAMLTQSGIAALQNTVAQQCMDVKSPWFGAMTYLSADHSDALPAESWETGNYVVYHLYSRLTDVALVNAELNFAYGNQAIIDRAALFMLQTIYSCSDLMIMEDQTPTSNVGHHYYYTHSNFYLEYITSQYYAMKNYLDPDVREVIEEALEVMTDKQMNARGNGPTNQYVHGVISAMYMYLVTGEERYHRHFKRGIDVFLGEPKEGWGGLGMSPTGFFVEQAGADGNYGHMNNGFLSTFIMTYCKSALADPEIVELINDAAHRASKFEAMFHGYSVDGLTRAEPNHFTSRTDSTMTNKGGQSGTFSLLTMDSIQKRIWERPNAAESFSALFPWFMNTEELAINTINDIWEKYDHYYDNSTRFSSIIGEKYETYMEMDNVESEPLPFEKTDAVTDELPGIIGVNWKDMYLLVFYNDMLTQTNIATPSFFGGGPSMLSTKFNSGVINSKRHLNSMSGKVDDANSVISTCIFGNKGDGSLFVSGKEDYNLEWLEENKIFKISGQGNGLGKTISWTYELADEGIIMTAAVDGLAQTDDMWVNLPIQEQTAEGYDTVIEDGKLTLKYKTGETVFEWDPSLRYEFKDALNGINRLQIKLPIEGSVKITMKTNGAE